MTLPLGLVIIASPLTRLASFVENPAEGLVKEVTACASKKGYTCVFGRKSNPSKVISFALTNGINAVEITFVPLDSRSTFSTTSVLTPVLTGPVVREPASIES